MLHLKGKKAGLEKARASNSKFCFLLRVRWSPLWLDRLGSFHSQALSPFSPLNDVPIVFFVLPFPSPSSSPLLDLTSPLHKFVGWEGSWGFEESGLGLLEAILETLKGSSRGG